MNIKDDECYAIVDKDGNRYGGWNNRWDLFETLVGAKRQLPKLQQLNRYKSGTLCEPKELKIVKIKFEVVN